jgi:uncharacterized protein (DUF302 family)
MEGGKSYAFEAVIDRPYEQVVEDTRKALKEEGFGVLTEIDVKETLKEKLNVDFRKYIILGACNPPFAHRALEADPGVGIMLPCNVVVYEGDDQKIHVEAINPISALEVIQNERLRAIAEEVSEKLSSAVKKLKTQSR